MSQPATIAIAALLLWPTSACLSAHAEDVASVPTLTHIETIQKPKTGRAGTILRNLTRRSTPGELFIRPYGVAWLDGSLIVTDPDAAVITRISEDGTVKTGGRAEEPIDVTVCEGRIFVSDSRGGRIEELDRSLDHVGWLATDLDRPTGLGCSLGRVLVAETGAHRIVLFGRDGSRSFLGTRGAAEGEFNFPVSIEATDEWIVVADVMNFRIQRFAASTLAFQNAFGRLGDAAGDFPRIKGIAADRHGNVWIADAFLDQLSVYDASGRYLGSVGEPGGDPGQFAFPAGLAFDRSGRLAVVDSINRRVQIFRLGFDGATQ